MKKRTVISTHIDWNNHTAYVKNQGIEELSLFKKLTDNGIELKDEELSDEELLALLRHLCIDGIIETVISVPNNYNRDQKGIINPMKRNIEQKLEAKGLEIIAHCDWNPVFDYGGSTTINTRNYLTNLNENIREKTNEYNKLDKEYDELIEEYNDYKENEKNRIDNELKEYYESKSNGIEKEIKSLENEIESNKEKIRRQNWYLNETKEYENKYNEKKLEFDKLVERYRNGEKAIKEQYNNLPNELKENIEKLENIKLCIKNREDELNKLNKIKQENDSEIYRKKNEIENNLRVLNNINDNIVEKISNIINSITSDKLSFKEAKEKFINTVKMYVQNDRNIPDFEIEYAQKIGLDKETIKSIITNIFN